MPTYEVKPAEAAPPPTSQSVFHELITMLKTLGPDMAIFVKPDNGETVRQIKERLNRSRSIPAGWDRRMVADGVWLVRKAEAVASPARPRKCSSCNGRVMQEGDDLKCISCGRAAA